MRTRLRRPLMGALCLLLLAAPARAGIIANGLAPPNPENVVEDDSHLVLDVYDLGCPDGDPDGTPCSSEVHTEVLVTETGVTHNASLYGSSVLTLEGDIVSTAWAYANSRLFIEGGQVAVYRGHPGLWLGQAASATLRWGTIGNDILLHDTSSFVMSGGWIRRDRPYIFAWDDSEILLSGGTIVGQVAVTHRASMEMEGGWVQGSVYLHEDGQLEMTAGAVERLLVAGDGRATFEESAFSRYGLSVHDGAHLATAGGYLQGDLQALGSGVLEIDGLVVDPDVGVFFRGSSRVVVTGGLFLDDEDLFVRPWYIAEDARVELVGPAFQLDGVDLPFGPVEAETGRLTGTLLSGERIDVAFERSDPETATLLLVQGEPDRIELSGQEHMRVPFGPSPPTVARLTDESRLDVWLADRIDSVEADGASLLHVMFGSVEGTVGLAEAARAESDGGRLGSSVELTGEAAFEAEGGFVLGGIDAAEQASVLLQHVDLRSGIHLRQAASLAMTGGSVNDAAGALEPEFSMAPARVVVEDDARLEMTFVSAGMLLTAAGDSRVRLDGVRGDRPRAYLEERARIDIRNQSSLADVRASGQSRVYLHDSWLRDLEVGGEARADVQPIGRIEGGVLVRDAGHLVLRAHAFEGGFRTLEPAFGDITAYDELGRAESYRYVTIDEATISLAPALPVPEPSLATLQATVLLCLAAGRRLVRRGRRSRPAA